MYVYINKFNCTVKKLIIIIFIINNNVLIYLLKLNLWFYAESKIPKNVATINMIYNLISMK